MANLEEKIKAFLSDEKKSQAIAQDEEFLGAVSAGTATSETIVEKFGKAGLTLSEEEAANVKDTAKKLLDTPVEKLSDIEAKNVSGGADIMLLYNAPRHIGADVPLIGASVGAVGGLGCWIAGTVCKSKASKELAAGNTEKSKKLTKAANGLHIATGACLGASVLGVGVSKGVGILTSIYHAVPMGE